MPELDWKSILDAAKRGVLKEIKRSDVLFDDAWALALERFVKKFESAPEEIGDPAALAFVIGNKAALDLVRKNARHWQILNDQADQSLHPEPPPKKESDPRAVALAQCIERLSTRSQTIFLLKYLHETPVERIVAKTGMSAQAVYKVLERARKTLRDCIARRLAKPKEA